MTTILIDDERNFLNPNKADHIFTTADEAINFLTENPTLTIDEIWLDYVLLHSDGSQVCFFLSNEARKGNIFNIKKFIIHTSSWGGANLMKEILEESGYVTERFDISRDKTVIK